MKYEVSMPKYGQTMEEGTIIEWLKRPGDRIEKGDALLKIESDKTTLEVEAERSGYLVSVIAVEGSVVPCGGTIGYIGDSRDEQ